MKLTHVENCIEINRVLLRDVKDYFYTSCQWYPRVSAKIIYSLSYVS